MKNFQIESAAQLLQRQIWRERDILLPGNANDPFALLCPEVAANAIGVELDYREELGRFGAGSDKFEVAGILDRQSRRIAISKRFQPETMRFTAGHELGHWVLHSAHNMFRDRPVKGRLWDHSPRSPQEQEADYFSACFFVPARLLSTSFRGRFGSTVPLPLNDESAFWLTSGRPELLTHSGSGRLDFAIAVSSCQSFGGQRFASLAKQFNVSVTTMAIRLGETGLIDG